MAEINAQVTPIVGVSDLVLFRIVKDTATEFTVDEENVVNMRNKIVSRAYDPSVAEGAFYAANQLQVSTKVNKGGTLNLVISDLSPEEKQVLYGNGVTADGVTVASANDVSPEYLVAMRVKKAKDVELLQKFAKVVFSAPSESAETETDSISFQTAEISGTIVPLNYPVADADGANRRGSFLFEIDSTNAKYAALEAEWFTSGTAGIVPKPSVGV